MRKEKTTIRKKLIRRMITLVFSQTVLFLIVFLANGGFTYLEKSACNAFSNTVLSKKNSLENDMTANWSRLEDVARSMSHTITTRLHIKGKSVSDLYTDKKLNDYALGYLAKEALALIENNATVEVYVILQGYGESTARGKHCGFLFRDLDPDTYGGFKDILMEVGQSSIARSNNIALDSYWRSRFDFDDISGSHDFYTSPMALYESGERDYRKLGYWSEPYQWYPNDISVISYSVPIVVDEEQIGVLGVTLSEEYIEQLLNPQELATNGVASYALGRINRDKTEFEPYFVNGSMSAGLMEKKVNISLASQSIADNMYRISGTKNFVTLHTMGLYTKDSIYNNSKWALIAIEPESVLFDSARDLYKTIIIAMTISVIIAIMYAIVTGTNFTKPIVTMAQVIKKSDSRKNVSFPTSNVEEIDALGDAITALNESVRQNASKMSQIIELADLPMGVIDYEPYSGHVYCTYKIISLLGLEESDYEDGLLNRTVFDNFLSSTGLESLLEKEGEVDYNIPELDGGRWLRFKSLLQGGKVLLTVTDITRDVQEKKKIEYERDYDVLTNLLNRRAFRRIITDILNHPEQHALKAGAMIMWDLDNLKYVNDSYGHDYGDTYIRSAAKVFATLGKEGGIVSRISGDEFMAFIYNVEEQSKLLQLVQSVKDKLNSTFVDMPDGNTIAVRASGGIAWYPGDGKTYDDLKRYADFAMYETKNSYKGAFKEFDKSSYSRDSFIVSAKEEFNEFIDKKLLHYAYQPIVDARTGEVFAYEALMRPTTKTVSTPADIMRMARVQSKLPDIERLTFSLGIGEFTKQKRSQGKKLFINSIPNQMLHRSFMEELINEYHIDFKNVVVEIIESEQSDMRIMEQKETQIRELGGKIAVDDFGVGYSSESVLLHMNPDYVKVDMDIVQGISSDYNRQTIVKNLISYCRPRGIKVIAEGVENREDMATLIRFKVDYLQGFYLAEPKEELEEIPSNLVKQIRCMAGDSA